MQEKTNNLVSIIVPCFNQGHFLDETLSSVYEQSHGNWECLIVNDGSTDITEAIALNWSKKDARFVYLKKENGGLSSARNHGLDKAKGDYIQFLDSDDLLHKDKLAESLALVKGVENEIAITNFDTFKKKPTELSGAYCELGMHVFSYDKIFLDWDFEFTIPIHCALFSSNLFNGLRFSEQLKAKEDWLMWVMVFQKKPSVSFIDRPYALYRRSGNSMSDNTVLMNQNTLLAHNMIYDILSPSDQARFFNKILTRLTEQVLQFKNSKSIRIRDAVGRVLNVFKK